MTSHGFTWGLALLALLPAGMDAQRLDEGTLVVREGRREVARETFSILEGRGRGLPGTTLSSQADWPARFPAVSRSLLLSRSPEGRLMALQVDRATDGDTTRLVGEVSRDRLTVRIISGARESARQYPAGADLVVIPDSVLAAFTQVAALATAEGRVLILLEPSTGARRRVTATLLTGPAAGGDARVVVLEGDLSARVVFDANDFLLGVDLPASGLHARRQGH